MPDTIAIPTSDHLTEGTASRLLDNAVRLWERDRRKTIELDWRGLSRVDEPAGSIVAGGLVGSLAAAPLRVRLDLDRRRLRRLERTGIAFGLANRRGETELVGASAADLNLEAWRRSWVPRSRLINPEDLGESLNEPELRTTHHAAFVNAHLAGENHGRSELHNRLRPWLRHFLFGGADVPESDPTGGDSSAAFVGAFGSVLDELLRNVTEHAPLDISREPSVSLVRVALTPGDRAYLSVQDNGRGIIDTVREKLFDRLDDLQLLEGLVTGSVEFKGRARGMGLPEVWELTDGHYGRLSIATRKLRLDAVDGRIRVKESTFDLTGTVVTAMLRVPRDTPASA